MSFKIVVETRIEKGQKINTNTGGKTKALNGPDRSRKISSSAVHGLPLQNSKLLSMGQHQELCLFCKVFFCQ